MLANVRRKLAAFLAIVMVVSCFVVFVPQKTYADMDSVKYAKKITISTVSKELYFDMSKEVKKIKKVDITSSKPSVIKIDSSGFLVVKKPGTTKLTIKVKDKKGKTYKFKSNVKVVKYTNAFKSFKIGTKEIKSKFKKYSGTYFESGQLKTGKIKITPNKGWKLKSIKYEAYNYSEDKEPVHISKKIKNKAKINLNRGKGWDYYLTVKMYNKKTGLTEVYRISYWVF